MKIRWIRLKKICEELTGCPVRLTASTSLPYNLKGSIVQDSKGYHIILNACHVKTESEVVEVISHELAHIKFPGQHSNKYEEEMKRLLKQIKKRLGVEDEN